MLEHAGAEPLESLRSHYDVIWVDNGPLWLNRSNRATHSGYLDEQTRSHAETLINTNRVPADLAATPLGGRILYTRWEIAGSSRCLTKPWRNCHPGHPTRLTGKSRPGGRLIMEEYMRTEWPLADNQQRLRAAWLEAWITPDLDTIEEHAAPAFAAAFNDVRIRNVTPDMRCSLRRLYKLSLPGIAMSRFLIGLALHDDGTVHGNVAGSRGQCQASVRRCCYAISSARTPPKERAP